MPFFLVAPEPAAADFTGFYGGLNGGFASGRDGSGRGPGARANPGSASTAAPNAPPDARGLAPLRRDDLPASMRTAPKSLDGR